ncbi:MULTISPECIES: restriction endonuclease subunit S [Paenibacillus]|uniref:restriction endonuclease subunit S n=1 Tax=Paenibacillus TaxID=44249 RepID=UPI001C0FF80D|nr:MULTISPECIES: restriction endonuclease subunit S [Paenibacillus]MBU5443887.1 restriction endonuclease subunit S [Paenibacillus sp. MSJ-34]UUZ82683.1 restriction endonuclease subunit S [Paenibacillus sp. P26]
MSKKEKTVLVPKLRFPEFNSSGEWKVSTLNSLAIKITNKNKDRSLTRILTNSATDGVVDQSEYFEREIVTQSNIDNYFIVDEGDYVYNPRISTSAPVGPISKNKLGKGIMSPLYTVFRFNNPRNEFYEQYFKTNLWNSYLKTVSNTGARHDRISISTENFMKMPLPYPSDEEQQKIADCLSSLDDLITAEDKKLSALRAHKKGLMQKLFPSEGKTLPEWRFPEFKDSGEWTKKTLGQLGKLVSGLTYSPDDVRETGLLVLRSSNIKNSVIILDDNVYVRTDISGANLSLEGDILICVRNGSKTLIGKNAIIPKDMPLCTHGAFMTVLRAQNPQFVFQLLQTTAYERQVKADLGATINSINGTQLEKYVFFIPKEQKEQQKIADCLSTLDELITAQAKKIEALNTHKKGLMQGLFPSIKEVGE